MYKKYLVPDTWEHVLLDGLGPHLKDGEFPCKLENCPLCGPDSDIDYQTLQEELSKNLSRKETMARKDRGEWIKSDYYAALALHNFEVYNAELTEVRESIREGSLLEYVIGFARDDRDIKKGLKQAQVRDKQLRYDLEARDAHDLLVGPERKSDQVQLSKWGGGIEGNEARSISLKYGPNSFNILSQAYEPPEDKDVLLFIPCSQEKPYKNSRTHSVLMDELGPRRGRVHKVTVSGMYGPVPEEMETKDPVLGYEYILANEDTAQQELITKRLGQYLEEYGDRYSSILGYVASTNYRDVIEDAIDAYGRGTVFPRNLRALQLTEHFRNSNIQELLDYLDNNPPGSTSPRQ